MSIGKIVSGLWKPQTRTALKVATDAVWKNVANGRASGVRGITDGAVKDLLNLKQADDFIKRAGDVLSDNIMNARAGAEGMQNRVITKRLPSGTVVTEVFDVNGLAAKEVIGKKVNAISMFFKDKLSKTVINKEGGLTIVKPQLYAKPARIAGYAKVEMPFLSDYKGITERANAGDKVYDALLDSGLVPKWWA